MRRLTILIVIATFGALATARAREREKPVNVTGVSVAGKIEGENIEFTLEFDVEARRPEEGKKRIEVALVTGDVVMKEVAQPLVESAGGHKLRYDPERGTYYISWRYRGTYRVRVIFACRPRVLDGGPWREALFTIPTSNVRKLEVACDRTDLQVEFPGALRLEREVKDDVLTATALLGPGKPFAVRWKPEVRKLEAKLVMAAEVNTIVRAGAGALGVDTLFVFDISQGRMADLAFSVPKALSVTQVRGAFIRDWRITEAEDEERGAHALTVSLTREQTSKYALEITAETVLGEFPVEIELPVIEPAGVIRASGHLAVGTDSAIRLVVKEPRGLSQVDASVFRRIVLDRGHPRPLPRQNAFYYTYATSPYQMKLALEDIVPSFDATERVVLGVREEDLVIDAEVEIDVRDAPLRALTVSADGGFVVANVTGSRVEDYTVKEATGAASRQDVEIHFREPVIGRTLVKLRLELGESPLGKTRRIEGLLIKGAKTERGYVVLVAEGGVEIEKTSPEKLREVHTGSVPMRAPDAQLAYRFREAGWALEMLAREKPPGMRTEAFHMISIGEGLVYGSVVVTYYISGAPVDELQFRIPKELRNVEFVGADVRRWSADGDRWTVRLQRKVIGYYHVLVTYNQRYEAGEAILVGAVECERVDTQTGFIIVASRLNLKLTPRGPADPSLLDIDRDEVPPAYRLLMNAPILKTYKYVNVPHNVSLELAPYDRGGLIAAVGDMMEVNTEVFVPEGGEAQSVTRVRYRIKNSNRQFLALGMPEEVEGAWSVHLVGARGPVGSTTSSGRPGKRTRVAASRDEKAGTLLIPLERRLNPNEPITLDLEYAQVHEELGVAGRLALTAPRGDVPCTFARWKVRVPAGWVVYADEGGNMLPETEARPLEQRGLAAMMWRVSESWGWAFERLGSRPGGVFLGIAAVAVLALVFAFRRRAFLGVTVGVLVTAAVIVGAVAAGSPHLGHGDAVLGELREVSFSQVLNLEDDTPLNISIRAIRAWRRQASVFGAIVVPVIALLCLAGAAAVRRARRILAALGLTGAASALAQFPGLWPFLGHVFTWGAPMILALYLCGRLAARALRGVRAAPAAAALLLLVFLGPTGPVGCARGVGPDPNAAFVVDRVEYRLKAEKDTMEVDVDVKLDVERIEAGEPLSIPVMSTGAILVSPEEASRFVKVEREGDSYVLRVERRGRHEANLKFLSPLGEPGREGLRSFTLPMPSALTNRVELTIPESGQDIEAPTAVELVREETASATVARAIFGPGDECVFIWKPRERQTKLEKTAFFTELTSLVRFDAGLAECRHRLRFRIAQGELKIIHVRIPAGITVTAVEGADLGTWRFDPTLGELEVRLSRPASGEYELGIMAQVSCEGLPSTVDIGSPEALEAEHQRGVVGLATSGAVFIEVLEHPVPMNVEDFVRDAAALVASAPGVSRADIRQAYRYLRTEDKLRVRVSEVRPELRGREDASFSVGDDRLAYNGELVLEVAKAGVFSADLAIPPDYEIDSLEGEGLSHWDDELAGDLRVIHLHFEKRLLGSTRLKLFLSRAVAELPSEIKVPRVEVRGALKHTGDLRVKSGHGVRLSVAGRKGVSELDPVEMGIREQGVLVFRLLRPDWELGLKTEVVETRSVVDFLHVAKVTEGLVHHTTYLSYRLYNAGTKVFEVQVPEDALGVDITGREIAQLKETRPGSGLWRVELARKWSDLRRAYLLTVRYETRFDRSVGEVHLPSARAVGVDLQRGHIVVHTTEKVELTEAEGLDPVLRPADARSVPRTFGERDLSGAAFCYSSSTAKHGLVLDAKRHEAAALLEAQVESFSLTTVVTEYGESISRVDMKLIVGGKRYLGTRLPPRAEIWSLLVDNRSVVPSLLGEGGTGDVLLIPLGRASSGEVPVELSFVYVAPAPDRWRLDEQKYPGPKFDLPLKDMSWTLYLPEGFDYDDFEGTLAVDERTIRRRQIVTYDTERYEQALVRQVQADNQRAVQYLEQAQKQAVEGDQKMAKQLFENALNFSYSKRDLNEDARVQLRTLSNQQAVVALVGRRGSLRPRVGAARAPVQQDLGDMFSQAQAQRLESSLSKQDSENLQLIADRMILEQEKAAGFVAPLKVKLAPRGRVVRFTRSLEVRPNAEMWVSLSAKRARRPESRAHVWWGLALFVALACTFHLISFARSRWEALGLAFTSEGPSEPVVFVDKGDDGSTDEAEA